MEGPTSSTAAEIYIRALQQTAIFTALHPPKIWEEFIDDT